MSWPLVIQGGMGVGISSWPLAQAVSATGQLGVVSGTALDVIMARRLQDGDREGHVRRALARLPFPKLAARIIERFYVPGGKSATAPYVPMPMHAHDEPVLLQELSVAANFVEVNLAREGHAHPVGINYLEKIQVPHLPSIYGALLAGVDYIIMGAGIPARIPGAIDRLLRHEPATYPLQVAGGPSHDDALMQFDPALVIEGPPPVLCRPRFLPIVSSHVLAAALLKRANGPVDGFVVEGPTAGGHNAPPRGKLKLNADGEPVYGERDEVDLDAMRGLGVPFWLAGGYGTPERVRHALSVGAAGVQVGTAFAFSDESGMRPDLKDVLRQQALAGTTRVFTDPRASPTSFPLKIVSAEGSVSEREVYETRFRVCDLGYLREAYWQADGHVGFRCAAEPVSAFLAKGGSVEETIGRKCVCNALLGTMGLGQRRGDATEPPLVTSGDAIADISRFMTPERPSYSARDVVAVLLSGANQDSGEPASLMG